MSYKVNKIIYLLLGLVLGFFIGGGIIWWQIQQQKPNARINKEDSIAVTFSKPDIKAAKLDLKSKYKAQLIKYKIPATFIDSLKLDSTTLTLAELIALYSKEDFIDTSVNTSNQKNDDFAVSKDELLFSKSLRIIGDYQSNDSYDLDSILTDQRNSSKKAKNIIRVEFWRSPINYKGYKFDDTKLVLFGIVEYDNVSLMGKDNQLFVKYNKDFFQIGYTDDFKSLIPVKDASILKVLKSL
ncbi:MAG: hypothetical protein WCQ95_04435 [Bacteroidota bacterium]